MQPQRACADSNSADNDNFVRMPVRCSMPGEGGFSQDFAISPPGLRGLNRLTVRLDAMMRSGKISNWHLGRWKNRARTVHSVLFSSAHELDAARLGAAV